MLTSQYGCTTGTGNGIATNNEYMKNKLSWGIALLPFVPSVWMQGQEQKQGIGNRRPNIIFIMSDDHARQAMSIYGHPIGKIAPTPHIDRIGHEGAVFQNNYCCNSPG